MKKKKTLLSLHQRKMILAFSFRRTSWQPSCLREEKKTYIEHSSRSGDDNQVVIFCNFSQMLLILFRMPGSTSGSQGAEQVFLSFTISLWINAMDLF